MKECGEVLWTLVATHTSNLHGTELTSEFMDNLDSLKHKSVNNSTTRDDPSARSLVVKLERFKINPTHRRCQ